MKQIILSEEEAKIIINLLKNNWVPYNVQRTVFELINRIEKELQESDSGAKNE